MYWGGILPLKFGRAASAATARQEQQAFYQHQFHRAAACSTIQLQPSYSHHNRTRCIYTAREAQANYPTQSILPTWNVLKLL
jgi:hypothetical protein